ncbi:hypothetical protein M758_4G036300 [Ceratodon purpureus]|nr:hypothetical protein M758_4G036300 [Ceratodon purpureus]
MVENFLIGQGLCRSGVILLVMAMSPIANKIHNNIRLKFLPPLHSQSAAMSHSFRVISIAVKNWGSHTLFNITWVRRGASELGVSREAYLVVDDDMDCASCITSAARPRPLNAASP